MKENKQDKARVFGEAIIELIGDLELNHSEVISTLELIKTGYMIAALNEAREAKASKQ